MPGFNDFALSAHGRTVKAFHLSALSSRGGISLLFLCSVQGVLIGDLPLAKFLSGLSEADYHVLSRATALHLALACCLLYSLHGLLATSSQVTLVTWRGLFFGQSRRISGAAQNHIRLVLPFRPCIIAFFEACAMTADILWAEVAAHGVCMGTRDYIKTLVDDHYFFPRLTQ